MLDIIWDLFQQGQINDLQRERDARSDRAKTSERKAETLEARLHDLELRHEQLKLVTLALWSLLRDHSGLLESDLRKYVEKIDLLDGKRDGKVSLTKEKTTCPGCKRSLLGTSPLCVYCGTPLKRSDPFQGA